MFDNNSMTNKRIAILAADGFEQSELLEPKKALEDAGAIVEVISLEEGPIKAWNKDNWGKLISVDRVISQAISDNYHALVLPGGVMSPDKLRMDPLAIEFISGFTSTGKPIGAICHGLWPLIETNILAGRTVTSWPSLRTDLINAGAKWIDQEVVVDKGLVTSRNPSDIPAFNKKLIEEISEGRHYRREESVAEKMNHYSSRDLPATQ